MVGVREVIWTVKFEREVRKLKDVSVKGRVKKEIARLVDAPESGKPMRFALKGERSIRIAPYRLTYSLIGDKLYLLRFEHRSKVYDY